MTAHNSHHFVPQFYFRYFSTDEKSICVLLRTSGKVVSKASIRGQACKSKFYGTIEVKKSLAALEGECNRALRRLIDSRHPPSLEGENIKLVLTWLALQRSRTMAAREMTQPMHDKLLRLFLEMSIGNDSSLKEEERKEHLGSLDQFETNPVRNQLLGMQIAMQSAGYLADLYPVLLVNRTNRPFIFGDAPVIFYNGFYRKVRLRGVLGADTPGLLVFFPLGPTLQLMLIDTACYQMKRLRNYQIQVRDLKDVVALNKLQIHAATSCVYFQDMAFAAYVGEIWRQEKEKLAKRVGMVVEALGFDADTGKPMGDIVHSFEPQLPFVLALSFMTHDVLGDGRYGFQRRSERAETQLRP